MGWVVPGGTQHGQKPEELVEVVSYQLGWLMDVKE